MSGDPSGDLAGVPSLHRRLDALEAKLDKAPPGKGRAWELVEKLAIPLVILVVGWMLKDSVAQALEREKLGLAYTSQMQSLLAKLADPDQTLAEKRASALTLSAFGAPAVAPLVTFLQEAGSFQALAAKEGLRAVAFVHPEPVCEGVTAILANRTRRHPWPLYLDAVELAGEQGCLEARDEIDDLRRLVAGDDREKAVQGLAGRARPEPAPTWDGVQQLRQRLEAATTALTAAAEEP